MIRAGPGAFLNSQILAAPTLNFKNLSAMAVKNLVVAFIIFAVVRTTTSQTTQRPLAGIVCLDHNAIFPVTDSPAQTFSGIRTMTMTRLKLGCSWQQLEDRVVWGSFVGPSIFIPVTSPVDTSLFKRGVVL